MVDLDGSAPREILAEFLARSKLVAGSAAWHPDGRRVTVWAWDLHPAPVFGQCRLAGVSQSDRKIAPEIVRQLEKCPP